MAGLLCTGDQVMAETSTWLYTRLTTETSMPMAGFKPAIPESKQLQAHALDLWPLKMAHQSISHFKTTLYQEYKRAKSGKLQTKHRSFSLQGAVDRTVLSQCVLLFRQQSLYWPWYVQYLEDVGPCSSPLSQKRSWSDAWTYLWLENLCWLDVTKWAGDGSFLRAPSLSW